MAKAVNQNLNCCWLLSLSNFEVASLKLHSVASLEFELLDFEPAVDFLGLEHAEVLGLLEETLLDLVAVPLDLVAVPLDLDAVHLAPHLEACPLVAFLASKAVAFSIWTTRLMELAQHVVGLAVLVVVLVVALFVEAAGLVAPIAEFVAWRNYTTLVDLVANTVLHCKQLHQAFVAD